MSATGAGAHVVVDVGSAVLGGADEHPASRIDAAVTAVRVRIIGSPRVASFGYSVIPELP
jgi:hypothetical protein